MPRPTSNVIFQEASKFIRNGRKLFPSMPNLEKVHFDYRVDQAALHNSSLPARQQSVGRNNRHSLLDSIVADVRHFSPHEQHDDITQIIAKSSPPVA